MLEQGRLGMSAVRLQNVFLHVTRACNFHCSYCYISAGDAMPDEMSTIEYRRLWSEIVALRPRKVVFTGGEPLLRDDILQLLSDLRAADPEHHVLRCLNTNGHLMTNELAKSLVGPADELRVSLDAMRERNDTIRGDGAFDLAVGALRLLHSVGFEPIVMVTVTSGTLPDLEELLCFLHGMNMTRIHLNRFHPIGRARECEQWQVKQDEVRSIMRKAWERNFPGHPHPSDPPEPSETSNCGVGSFLNILPNGDVYPCHVLMAREFHCGNIREQGLMEICDRNGLLGRLAAMDFKGFRDKYTANVTPYVCMRR